MEVAQRLHGVGEYYFSTKLKEIRGLNAEGRNVLNHGIGSPDLPPHPDVLAVLVRESARKDVHGYQPYNGSPILRNAIANWYTREFGVDLNPEDEILPLMGSKEGILHLCMTYLNPGDQVLVPDPGYPTYRSAAALAGGVCVSYALLEEHDYVPDFEALEQQDLSRVKLCFLNYPQMPTGQPPSPELFQSFIAFAKRHDILLIHDNPYCHIQNPQPLSILQIPGAITHAVELCSLSKSHNMAGWRVGMLSGAAEHIANVLRFRSNMESGMFLPVQLAAAKALELSSVWYAELNTVYSERKEVACTLLDLLQCSYRRDQAGLFVWGRVPDGGVDGYQLSDTILFGANVFITPGGIFGEHGKRYVRISLCSPVERIAESIARISDFIKYNI